VTDWQPIETMPMREAVLVPTEDGTAMAKRFHRYISVKGWDFDMYLFEGEPNYPTHWMPIPEGPKP